MHKRLSSHCHRTEGTAAGASVGFPRSLGVHISLLLRMHGFGSSPIFGLLLGIRRQCEAAQRTIRTRGQPRLDASFTIVMVAWELDGQTARNIILATDTAGQGTIPTPQ